MQLTRRDILAAVAAAVALVASPGAGEAAQSPWGETWPHLPEVGPATATRDEFESQINQVFRVQRPGRTAYGLSLAAVQDAAAARRAGTVGSRSAFTVVFVGPAADPLQEGTYDVVSAVGSEYALFLKRGAVGNGLQCYEAPFNNPETLDRTFGSQPNTAS